MDTSGGTDDIFEEAVETLGGGAAGGGVGGAPEPEGEGQTPAGSPWWAVWCDRIGAGEEGLDATRTNLALQLQAQDHAAASRTDGQSGMTPM